MGYLRSHDVNRATVALPSASVSWDYSTDEISKAKQTKTRSLNGSLLVKLLCVLGFFLLFIGVELFYNVALVSAV